MPLYTIIFPTIPAIIIVFLVLIRIGELWGFGFNWFIALLIGVGLFLSTACISFTFKVSHIYGILHTFFSYFGILTFFLLVLRDLFRRINRTFLFSSWILSGIMLIIAIPTSVIPNFPTQKSLIMRDNYGEIKLDFISESLSKIKDSFDAVELNVSEESKNIDKSINNLLNNIDNSNNELKRLKKEQMKLSSEIDQYKKLASVTEQQATAIRTMIRRGKYLDYIIGFFIGLTSSTTILLIKKYSKRLFES